MTQQHTLRINGERLWARLEEIGQIGATAGGGCNRQALTDEDRIGRELFAQWAEQAGCTLRRDAVGNLFARREGSDPELPPVITGSHLDTQPSGGKYDGIYGVLGGLEVLQTLQDAGVQTRHPLEVVVWTNEEGCRFDTAMMGSAVWAGVMPLEAAYALTDRNGASVKEELERTGQLGELAAAADAIHAAFELHIEQGPVLEAEQKTIGVVTGVQHMSRHRVVYYGQEAHAGPTPMTLRKDPMMALGQCLPQLYAMTEQHGADARITFGFVHADPGSSNTVPGRLEFTVDIRHPEADHYQAMLQSYEDIINAAAQQFELKMEYECFWEAPGVEFDHDCVAAVQSAVDNLGYSHRRMVSGAGHDACNVAKVAPTSMIFIPCKDGLSHNEKEAVLAADVEAGANILLQAMLTRAELNN